MAWTTFFIKKTCMDNVPSSCSSGLPRGLDPFDDRWSDHQLFAIVPPWNMAPLSLLNRSGKLFCSYSLFSYLDNSTPWFGARHRSQCVWLGRHNRRKEAASRKSLVRKAEIFFLLTFSSFSVVVVRARFDMSRWLTFVFDGTTQACFSNGADHFSISIHLHGVRFG